MADGVIADKAAPLERCTWCNRGVKHLSDWEQQTLSGKWKPLCRRCARERFRNPYQALLSMRKREAR